MAVLRKVTVNAMHSLFQVNVLKVHRLGEFIRIVGRDYLVVLVQQIAVAIFFVDCPEDPTMAVEVGELSVLQGLGELRTADLVQEAEVRPQAALGRPLGISQLYALLLRRAGIVLLGGIHLLPIHFIVPPGVSEIGGHHVRAGVHMADHALARRDRTGELMNDGMA